MPSVLLRDVCVKKSCKLHTYAYVKACMPLAVCKELRHTGSISLSGAISLILTASSKQDHVWHCQPFGQNGSKELQLPVHMLVVLRSCQPG